MRIVHVITRLIVGGAQENTLLNCRDLIEQYGDEVTLVTGPPLGPEGSLIERARRLRIPLVEIDALRRNIDPLRDWRAWRRLSAVLRELRPDVVHTHSAKAGLLGRCAAWSLRVPAVVHTVHGAPFHPYQGRGARAFFRGCERFAARRCHALISVADALTEQLVAAGVAPREKFTTIYSGLEVEPFLEAEPLRAEVRRRLQIGEAEVVVGKVARLFHLKGHDDFLSAAVEVARRVPQARFLLVGGGARREELEAAIAGAGLRERFLLTGLVPPEEIPGLLAAMDLVVHTSLREGLARVLPQALLAGRPVVSYDIDGAGEVVLPERTGLLLPPGDVAGLAEAVVRLAGDAPLRARLAAAGRRLCADRYRHETMSAQIRTLYARLLERGSG